MFFSYTLKILVSNNIHIIIIWLSHTSTYILFLNNININNKSTEWNLTFGNSVGLRIYLTMDV